MAQVEWRVRDLLRGGLTPVTLRFDPNDTVLLSCHYNYDPELTKQVHLLRNIEIKNEDGTWSLYPSVAWIDGVQGDELVTRAIVKKTGEEGPTIMSSTDGVPDGELMIVAKEAGIHTETING